MGYEVQEGIIEPNGAELSFHTWRYAVEFAEVRLDPSGIVDFEHDSKSGQYPPYL